MNFFEHQQLARRNTGVMVVLFILAVVAIVAAIDALVAGLWLMFDESPAPAVPRELWVAASVATLAIVLVVSLVNVVRLAGGGAKVAQMMGGRLVASNTQDRLERRLLNIVEEMAIASGVRMPQVYVMDKEKAINAFAAGWSVSGAVVAVTRGTLEKLTRDELQGVIGHEFSHILNGDMGLNIRMIGVLAGIVAIGSIGGFVMRNAFEADDLRAGIFLFVVGLLVFIIGYTGLFFARLIKAAVSRQREYLADASSVQFTRNPDGIAGALDQIRVSGAGTLIQGRYAEDMSHMFFGRSVKVRLAGLFDTHPSLEERIRRVHPSFQITAYRQRRAVADAGAGTPAKPPEETEVFATLVPPAGRRGKDVGASWGRTPEESAALVGHLDSGKVDYAARLLSTLPEPLREALRDPGGAAPALVALLLAPNDQAMKLQMDALQAAGLSELGALARAAFPHTRGLGLGFHLPVIDLGLATMRAAPEAEKKNLIAALEAVAQADRRVSLHEFVVLTLVRDQLAPRGKPLAQRKRIADLAKPAGTLLALVAHAGTRRDAKGVRQEELQAALDAGAKVLGIPATVPEGALSLDVARAALEALKELAPMQKAVLIKGLFAAVTADGTIRVGEAGLMRMVGAVLDCPLPPMLNEIDPAALAA